MLMMRCSPGAAAAGASAALKKQQQHQQLGLLAALQQPRRVHRLQVLLVRCNSSSSSTSTSTSSSSSSSGVVGEAAAAAVDGDTASSRGASPSSPTRRRRSDSVGNDSPARRTRQPRKPPLSEDAGTLIREIRQCNDVEQLLHKVDSFRTAFFSLRSSNDSAPPSKVPRWLLGGLVATSMHQLAVLSKASKNPLRRGDDRLTWLLEKAPVGLYSPRDLATAAWALATLKEPSNEAYKSIARRFVHVLSPERVNAQDLAMVAWAYAKAQIDAPHLYAALARTIPDRAHEFSAQGLSNVAWAFATRKTMVDRRTVDDDKLFDSVANAALTQVDAMSAQHISSLCYALAKAQKKPSPALFDALARVSVVCEDGDVFRMRRDFSPQALANTAWAFATARHDSPRLISAIADTTALGLRKKHGVGARETYEALGLSQTAWAIAHARSSNNTDGFFDAVAEALLPQLNTLSARELSNLARSYHKKQHCLFSESIAKALCGKVEHLRVDDLAFTLWAFSTKGNNELFAAIAGCAPGKILAMNPASSTDGRTLSMCVAAYARCGVAAPQVFEAVARVAWSRVPDFAFRDVAEAAWAFSAAGVSAPALFEAIASTTTTRHHREMSPQWLSMTAWAFATAGHSSEHLFSALEAAALKKLEDEEADFPPQALANTAWAFATVGVDAPRLFSALALRATACLDSPEEEEGFTAQGMANVAWALARGSSHQGAGFIEALAAAAKRLGLRRFKAQELANVAWAVASIGDQENFLLALLATESAARIGEFKPRELSSLAACYARSSSTGELGVQFLYEAIARASLAKGVASYHSRLTTTVAVKEHDIQSSRTGNNVQNEDVQRRSRDQQQPAAELLTVPQTGFNAVEHHHHHHLEHNHDAASSTTEAFDPASLALLAWGFSKARIYSYTLFEAIAVSSQASAAEWHPPELSMTAWAFATARIPAPALFESLADAVVFKCGDFQSRELASTAWAFATAKAAEPALFEAIAWRAQDLGVGDFKPQELANTAWAFSTAGHPAPELFRSIAHAARGKMDDFSTQELANIAWAFAKHPPLEEEEEHLKRREVTTGLSSPLLFAEIAESARKRLDDFTAQELANTAWAFSKLSVPSPDLYDEIAARANIRLAEFKPKELQMLEWAYARYPALFPKNQ